MKEDVRRDMKLNNTWKDAVTRNLATYRPNYGRIEKVRRTKAYPLIFLRTW